MAFDGEGVVGVLLQPLRLLVEGRARLHRQFGRIRLEEHAVADIDHEVLLASRRSDAGRGHGIVGLLVGACGQRKTRDQRGGDPSTVDDTRHKLHPGLHFDFLAGPHPSGCLGFVNKPSTLMNGCRSREALSGVPRCLTDGKSGACRSARANQRAPCARIRPMASSSDCSIAASAARSRIRSRSSSSSTFLSSSNASASASLASLS